MHIPDGFLSGDVAAVTGAASVVTVAYGLRRAGSSIDERRVPLLGVAAAFIFAAQMLNFPVAGGTSGHFPRRARGDSTRPLARESVMAVVISAQAFVFADGGITALGANVLNMGIIGALLVGLLVGGALRVLPRRRSTLLIAAGAGAWLAVMLGATATSLELAIGNRPARDRPAGDARGAHADRPRRGRRDGRRRERGARHPPRPARRPRLRAIVASPHLSRPRREGDLR